MTRWTRLRGFWQELALPDKVRLLFALGFPLGALGHLWWVARNGLFYHGPAPPWAVWFWYALCIVDVIVCYVMLRWPKHGIGLAVAVMAVSLIVNWTQFPTFEYRFNWVLIGLTTFGVTLFACAPWLWRRSRWATSWPRRA